MRYAWIFEHKKSFSINIMSKVIKVDKSSYYHWIKVGSIVKKVDTQLNGLIAAIFSQGINNYGTRRIQNNLL